ncbi:MAG: hypothetical protein QXU45_08020 [Candidatus Bathyarchaeia archaeon]
MAVTGLFLSVLFKSRLHNINRLCSYVKPEVFSRSFVVFNPYSQVTIFHRFLLLAVIGIWYGCMLLLYFFFKALESGFLFPFVLVVVCLNLLPLEAAFEVYRSSGDFVKALRNGLKFGVGDIEVLKSLKKILNRLSNYCLGLSVAFFVSALLLPIFWSRFLLGFSSFSAFWDVFVSFGVVGVFILVLVVAIVFVGVFVFASLVKKRLLYG